MEISNLEINDKTIGLIMIGLATECHEFAFSRGIPSNSVESQLEFVLGVINRDGSSLFDFPEDPTVYASDIAAIRVGFSDEGYRLLASAAKDRMAKAFDANANI